MDFHAYSQSKTLAVYYPTPNSRHQHMIANLFQISIGAGCEAVGMVLHLMMHSLGFKEENSRPDRDYYVTINWRNIKPGKNNKNT